jgi:hypothetical protein
MRDPLVHLAQESRGEFGRRPLLATHDLENHELFGDDALAEFLDGFPRRHLYALTMGADLTRPDENRLAVHDGVSGKELLRAVRNGKLWLNVTRVDRADADYRRLISQLYEQIAAQVPGFEPIASQGTLLISSPHALVYYHADAPASALWHIRGRKRIWIYPALDERFASRDFLEDIFAGVRHEYLPYRHEFDDHAEQFDLEPGQWISWPQNAPHRVTNLDSVNVSLSTEYFTKRSLQRQRVYMANRFFRTRFGARLGATESGFIPATKTFVHRIAYKLGWDRVQYRSHDPAYRVDADAPNGVAPLSAPLGGEVESTTHRKVAAPM